MADRGHIEHRTFLPQLVFLQDISKIEFHTYPPIFYKINPPTVHNTNNTYYSLVCDKKSHLIEKNDDLGSWFFSGWF
jgi:hypothetical protein